MFNLDQALAAIKDKTEFSCNERNFGHVIDYYVTMKDTFIGANPEQTSILQNLRGTCFNHQGEIIRLCYHKFHNLNENDSYRAELFDFGHPHVVEEKLDGSMIAPIPVANGWVFGTRAGQTDVSNQVSFWFTEELEEKKQDLYFRFINLMMLWKLTPIFEFCSRRNKIVIDHPQTKLVLTGVRDIRTGRYILPLSSLDHFGIDLVSNVLDQNSSIDQLAQEVRPLVGKEGVVVKFTDGRFVKIKAEDYVTKHRALDGLRFEKDILDLILNDKLDDVLPLVSPEMAENLRQFRDSVESNISTAQSIASNTAKMIKQEYPERKDYAQILNQTADSLWPTGKSGTGLYFKFYDNPDYSLRDFAKGKLSSQTTVDEIRWLIGPGWNLL